MGSASICSAQAEADASLVEAQQAAFQEEARESLGFVCAADRSRRAHAVRTVPLTMTCTTKTCSEYDSCLPRSAC